jgi:hypothetical protein
MLTPEEKARRKRDRMIVKAREYQIGTYCHKFVARVFQRMIRAEAAAQPAGYVNAVIDGEIRGVYRRVGDIVCVTCGKRGPWRGNVMDTGHFLASRANSILFEEDGVVPQCKRCNGWESGAPQRFRQWMLAVRGADTVERLEKLKRTTRQFTREELVDMRIEFQTRLDRAEEKMKGGD